MVADSEVVKDFELSGYRVVIVENEREQTAREKRISTSIPKVWHTAYIEIPEDNPIRDIWDELKIPDMNAHGGITYNRSKLHALDEDQEDSHWIGWDYNHARDDGSETLDDVEEDVQEVVDKLEQVDRADVVLYQIRFLPDHIKENVEVKLKDE